MIKNITDKYLTLQHNGIAITLQPQEHIDTLAFMIPQDEVGALEARFGSKYQGQIQILRQPNRGSAGESEDIQALKKELAEAKEIIEENAKTIADLQQTVLDLGGTLKTDELKTGDGKKKKKK